MLSHLILIQLAALFTVTAPSNPFAVQEDDWIANYLQSSFTRSTDVLFIVDNVGSLTCGVSRHVLDMFGHQKALRIVTMDGARRHYVSNLSLIEKLWVPSQKDESKSHEERKHRTTQCPISVPIADRQDGKFYHMEMTISRRTTLVVLIKEFVLATLMQDAILRNPSAAKMILVYGQCVPSTMKAFEEEIKDFSEDAWSRFRVLFTYFIPLCSKKWQLSETRHTQHRPKWPEINNRTSPKNFINFMYVYDPFSSESSPRKGLDAAGDTLGQQQERYGCLRKINLSKDYRTMEGIPVDKIAKINRHRLRIVLHPTSTAILKTDVPSMSHNLAPKISASSNSMESYFGLEIEVLKELAKRMNFMPHTQPSSDGISFGFKTENSTFNGAIGDIIYNRADFAMNGYFIKDYETGAVEFTTAVGDDRVCIAVKRPGLIPSSLLLFKVFSPPLWLLVVGTLLAVGTSYAFLLFAARKCNCTGSGAIAAVAGQSAPVFKSRNKRHNNELLKAVLHCARIIAVLLTAPQHYRFSSCNAERVLLSFCLWWGLNVIGVFQGSLVDVYTNKVSYSQMLTLDEFDRSNTRIAVRFAGLITDVFGNDDSTTHLGRIRRKMFPIEDDNYLNKIAVDGEFASLIRSIDIEKLGMTIPFENGKLPLYYIPECPRNYKIAYLFPKSSVFLPTVNRQLGNFAAAGLLVKWQKDTSYILNLASHMKNRETLEERLTVLTLKHLQLAFFALFFGYNISVLVFILELYFHKNVNRIYLE